MKILDYFRKSKLESNRIKRSPEIGDIWEFQPNDGSPWPLSDVKNHKVTILDVKDGWVRYKWNNATIWQDQRMILISFMYCYRFVSTTTWEALKE